MELDDNSTEQILVTKDILFYTPDKRNNIVIPVIEGFNFPELKTRALEILHSWGFNGGEQDLCFLETKNHNS